GHVSSHENTTLQNSPYNPAYRPGDPIGMHVPYERCHALLVKRSVLTCLYLHSFLKYNVSVILAIKLMIFMRVSIKSATKKGKIIQSSLFSFLFLYYSASATTSSTSGTILFSKPSIPAFKVMVDDGQPLHDPRSSTVTTPSSNERYAMAPPSCSTAGRT